MIVEGRSSPERVDLARKAFLVEGSENLFPRRKVKGHHHVPSRRLSKTLCQVSAPKTSVAVAWTIANHQHSTRRNAGYKPVQQARLFVRPKIMQKVEEHDIASVRNRLANILFDELKVAVGSFRNRLRALDFAAITIETSDRRDETSLPQIEGQQANSASDIDERLI